MIRSIRLGPAAIVSVLVLGSGPAGAQWLPDGIPVGSGPGLQEFPTMISDGSGGAFIAWQDFRNGSWDIYAQHITAAGSVAPGWTPNGVAVCQAPDTQGEAALAPDGTGGIYVAWEDRRSPLGYFDLRVTRLANDGSLSPGWPVCGILVGSSGGLYDQTRPALLATGPSGVFVTWEGREGGIPFIRVVRISSGGTLAPGWEEGPLRISLRHSSQYWPQITGDGSDGVFVSWVDESSPNYRVYLQRVTGARSISPGWPAEGLALGNVGQQGENGRPRIADDGAGGAYVTWADIGSGDWEVRTQRVTGAGTLALGWSPGGLVSGGGPGHQYAPRVAVDGAGGLFATWNDSRNGNNDVFAQHITPSGTIAPGWSPGGSAICSLPSQQWHPNVTSDGTGGAILAWRDFRNGGAFSDLYAIGITSTNTVAPGWNAEGSALCTAANEAGPPLLVPRAPGQAIAAWVDGRNDDTDVFAGLVQGDPATPVALSLVDVTVEPGVVRLRWWTADAGQLSVYRHDDMDAWLRISSISPNASGILEFEDHDVLPGQRYGYRLGVESAGGEQFLGEAWVDVPRLEFALHGAHPNPSSGGLVVSFSLPEQMPAIIELFDISGRRHAHVKLDAPDPGRQVVAFDRVRALRPGVYVVRLTQGQRTLSTTATLLR